MEKEDGKINYARRGWLSLLAVPATVIIYAIMGRFISITSLWNINLVVYVLLIFEFGVSDYFFFVQSKTKKQYLIPSIILFIIVLFLAYSTFFGALFD